LQEIFGALPRVAFWLVPQYEDRYKLSRQIDSLAERFSSPCFVPHVTLYSCFRSPDQQELAHFARLAGTFETISMRVKALDSRDRIAQALYLDLMQNDDASQLYRALHECVPRPSNYQFRPHLSLLYQHLSEDDCKTLQRDLTILVEEISFNELWAVAIPARLASLEDFYGWQTLLICRLDSLPGTATINGNVVPVMQE